MNLQLIQNKILTIRDQQVILDRDVAELYGVETKRVNEAVKNNPEKFPEGYIISMDNEDLDNLRSKFLTSSLDAEEVSDLRSKISTANISSKSRVLPKAFTEKGLYMLATILKSPSATETTLAIVETFAKIRELSRIMMTVREQPDQRKQKTILQKSGELISDILYNNLETTETETTFELNLFAFGVKHTIKKKEKQ
ncbi:hypothetical protein AGMMS50262_20160 [Bacteroidia bacterium]|nr:hypothetical protein AGMMS50262_20160 [Bacteroidia bacterium]